MVEVVVDSVPLEETSTDCQGNPKALPDSGFFTLCPDEAVLIEDGAFSNDK